MSKVAIYCRLSDEDKDKKNSTDESISIQNQKNLLMKYALEKDWEIYKIYSDDDYSGLDSDRPEFNKMLIDAQKGKFDIILSKTQSRFTRDIELVEKYIHNKFIDWNIRFVTVVDGVDTLDNNNKKSRQINGLVNEWYSEDTSNSIKAVFRHKQEMGEFIGSFPAYGYAKDPKNKGKLIVDQEAAEVVKLIFNLYLQGNGTLLIAQILNEKNIPNPTTYKKSKGLKYKNNLSETSFWSKTTVRRILRNEIYVGNMVQHKRYKKNYKSKKIENLNKDNWIIVKGTHELIIDEITFRKVQEKIYYKTRSSGLGKVHNFSGKVKCMDCKSIMNRYSNGKEYAYLRCKVHAAQPNKGLCTSHSIKVKVIEESILDKLKEYIEKYCDTEKLYEVLLKENRNTNNEKYLDQKLKRLNNDIKSRTEAIKNLYLDKINNIISIEQFNELNSIFLEEKERFFKEKRDIENKIERLKEDYKDIEKYIGFMEKLKNLTTLNHLIINEIIDFIEIGEKDKITGEREIKIWWNF